MVQNKWTDAANYATEALSKPKLQMIGQGDIYSGFNNSKMKDVMWASEIIADQSNITRRFSHMDASAWVCAFFKKVHLQLVI